MKSKKQKELKFDKNDIQQLKTLAQKENEKLSPKRKRDIVKYCKRYEYKQVESFKKSTDKELIERFNSGANCYGWPRARMIVIYCLIQEMKKRFDLSEISHITTCISRFMVATWSEEIFLKNKKVYIKK